MKLRWLAAKISASPYSVECEHCGSTRTAQHDTHQIFNSRKLLAIDLTFHHFIRQVGSHTSSDPPRAPQPFGCHRASCRHSAQHNPRHPIGFNHSWPHGQTFTPQKKKKSVFDKLKTPGVSVIKCACRYIRKYTLFNHLRLLAIWLLRS